MQVESKDTTEGCLSERPSLVDLWGEWLRLDRLPCVDDETSNRLADRQWAIETQITTLPARTARELMVKSRLLRVYSGDRGLPCDGRHMTLLDSIDAFLIGHDGSADLLPE